VLPRTNPHKHVTLNREGEVCNAKATITDKLANKSRRNFFARGNKVNVVYALSILILSGIKEDGSRKNVGSRFVWADAHFWRGHTID
jgi:hypothetical protein